MTFSIVARSDDGESWGVAVASKFLAVGSAVPAAAAGVGAIATQADANLAYKYLGLAHLDDGATAQVALDRLVEEDEEREHRQVGIVDSDGNAATWTGAECFAWAGGVTGRSGERGGYAIQGNILTGPEVVEAMEQAWLGAPDLSMERRLLAALTAGDAAGGDQRGRQSAGLLVVRDGAGYGGHDDVAVNLRVGDHAAPVAELARLVDLHELYLTASTPDEQVPVDDALMSELAAFARDHGHEHFREWVGSENYEMRVASGLRPAWIDQRILAIVRGEAS
jgi:uncharacterized Ntn-hydrolase superfamily protein